MRSLFELVTAAQLADLLPGALRKQHSPHLGSGQG